MRKNSFLGMVCLFLSLMFLSCKKSSTTSILDNGLIGYWPLDASGTDLSPNANHGTIYGASGAEDRFGTPQRALYFDGVTSYIKCKKPGPVGNPTLSISFWIKTSSTKTGHLVSWGNNGLNGQDCRAIINGNLGCAIGFDTYNNASYYSTTISTNNWDHYVVIYDGAKGSNVNSTTIYKNGSLLSAKCFTQNLVTTNIGSINPITIGRYHGTVQTGYFAGYLDELRLYDRVLSEKEIAMLASN